MIILPNMGLFKWDSINDFFSHEQLAANFQALDEHDHTTGKGEQIPYGGLAEQSVGLENLREIVLGSFSGGPIRTPHGFTYPGEVQVETIPGFYVSLAEGESIKLVGMKYKIGSGTNCKVSLIQNGSKLSGFKEIEVTTSAAEVSGKSVVVNKGDRFELTIESISGTPKALMLTLFLEHTH